MSGARSADGFERFECCGELGRGDGLGEFGQREAVVVAELEFCHGRVEVVLEQPVVIDVVHARPLWALWSLGRPEQ